MLALVELNNKVVNTVAFLRQNHCLKLNQIYSILVQLSLILPLLVITVKVKNVYGIFYTLYCDDPSCVRLSFKSRQKN